MFPRNGACHQYHSKELQRFGCGFTGLFVSVWSCHEGVSIAAFAEFAKTIGNGKCKGSHRKWEVRRLTKYPFTSNVTDSFAKSRVAHTWWAAALGATRDTTLENYRPPPPLRDHPLRPH